MVPHIDNFPASFQWGKKTISLSLSAAVTVSDQDRIINCENHFYLILISILDILFNK